jgi:hypothetical protein
MGGDFLWETFEKKDIGSKRTGSFDYQIRNLLSWPPR